MTLSRPLGRLPFFAGLSVVNIAIAALATVSLVLLPSRGASLAVLVVMSALQAVWLLLHVRRFVDAGRGPAWAIGFWLLGFGVFVLGYLVSASLWSVPEVQQEAFRTAGGIGGRMQSPADALPVLVDAGRAMADVLGAAGALFITGLIAIVFVVVAAVSAVFSTVTLLLPAGVGARSQPTLPGAWGRALR